MRKSYKVFDIFNPETGKRVLCIYRIGEAYNPYTVYGTWYDGGKHRKKIAAYADFESALYGAAAVLR